MEKCHCITAAARHRCPHFVYPNCWKNENEPYDPFEEARLREKLRIADSHVQYRKAEDVPQEELFKRAWSDYADRLQQQFEKHREESIIAKHYGMVNALKSDWKKNPLIRLWQEMTIAFVIVMMMPYMCWQFIRKPEDAHKLPFID